MKIAILGFGVEGHSAYSYWDKSDNQITICDKDEQIKIPSGVSSKLGSNYLSKLGEFDLIVRSPGIHPSEIEKANGAAILDKVTSVTDEFFKASPTKKIIGVTGTKGKGTTATLIADLLIEAGYMVHLGGNIGKPALDLLQDKISPEDWVVLELSSYQLIDAQHSPHIALCLMIVPEHLNWHADFNEYVNAKKNIFIYQSTSDIAIYYADNEYSKQLALASPGHKVPYYTEPGAYLEQDRFVIGSHVICHTNDVKLLGKHNWQNICAALTVYWQIDQNPAIARQVITNFHGLENRLEEVREQNSIKYYNDSFASVPDATIAAIEAIKGPKVIIVGGQDRGLDLNHFAGAIKADEKDIKQVILIGQSAKRVSNELKKAKFSSLAISKSKNMVEIVDEAVALAKPGYSIVLSPGFPSFDMFKDFEDRGKQFREAVTKL